MRISIFLGGRGCPEVILLILQLEINISSRSLHEMGKCTKGWMFSCTKAQEFRAMALLLQFLINFENEAACVLYIVLIRHSLLAV